MIEIARWNTLTTVMKSVAIFAGRNGLVKAQCVRVIEMHGRIVVARSCLEARQMDMPQNRKMDGTRVKMRKERNGVYFQPEELAWRQRRRSVSSRNIRGAAAELHPKHVHHLRKILLPAHPTLMA
jgi:hypothetical protein